MKKNVLIIIGIVLFVTAYRHTRRQAEYKLAKETVEKDAYAEAPSTAVPAEARRTFAFRFIKPS